MAEIAVNVVVVDKLVPFLAQESKLLKGVCKEVDSIKGELESIRSFLRNADVEAETDGSVKAWVKQVREVAYRTEDVMDEYVLHRSKQACQSCGLLINFVHEIACLSNKLIWRREISDEIQDIKRALCEIKARRDRYNFNSAPEQGSGSGSNSAVPWHYPGLASLEIVGFEEPMHQLNKGLLEGESKRTTIPLYGTGGLGKTTLTQIVFNNLKVKGKFDCHVWIAVSQSYNMVEILRTIMKQFNEKEEEVFAAMDQTQLIQELREFLQQKRYLVVFDDVWEIDFWGSMEHALPKNEKGSRIVITTRKSDVASSCVESSTQVIELQPLSQEEAWKLFCKKAFKSDLDGRCPPVLEELSLDIVKKCQGLPLAIVLIGGVLSLRNKVASPWRMFHDSLQSEVENNPQLAGITKTLALSYYDLPYNLKSCFLYFGIFPEDYSVRRGRLIRLWVANGFVKEAAGKTVEDVAEDYLNELIHRNLVKVSEVFFDGRARSCQIHDLVRDFILQKYNELNFCQVLSEQKDPPSFGGSTRRLSICNSKVNVANITNLPKLRSVCMFGENELPKRFPIHSLKLSSF